VALEDGVVGVPATDARRFPSWLSVMPQQVACSRCARSVSTPGDLLGPTWSRNSEVAGAVPLFEWLEGEAGTVFSY
jgi:hypothetical protein